MRKLLYKITGHMPCRLIYVNNKPYLERYFLGNILGITLYLHRFVSADTEREVHDHPWAWAFALVLTGGYKEERVAHLDMMSGWSSKMRNMFCGRINILGPSVFHRIGSAKRETYTLFVHGPRIKQWGFLTHGRNSEMTIYHQPHDVIKSACWEKTALNGCDAAREPFKK